jgi:haloalkane dehalogenase
MRITLRDGEMHYVDEGSGPPMLFVHGTPTNSYEYRHLIAALSKRHRCIAPDHLGFGASSRPRGFAYTPEAHAAVLNELVERLGLDDLTLVVHDFGGPIGLPLVLGPSSRVRRVILMNTWAWPIDDDPGMARGARLIGGAAGRFLYRYANASLRLIMPSAYGDRKKLTPEIHRRYLDVFRDRDARVRVLHTLARSLLGSRAHYQSLFDRLDALARLPVLIVWGMKDSAFQPYQLERWQRLLPDARVERIEDAGHWPHEEAPARVVDAIERFLQPPRDRPATVSAREPGARELRQPERFEHC